MLNYINKVLKVYSAQKGVPTCLLDVCMGE